MKATTLIICSLLVFAAVAVEMNDDQAMESLKRIESSRFGKTIIDTITIQLQAGDKMDDLIELLKSIESQLIEQQNADDSAFAAVRGEFDRDSERLNTEIAAADNRAQELNDELAEKIPLRKEKIELQADKEDEAEGYIERIGELDEEKTARDEEWAEVAAEHDRATYVIERAKEVIENGFSGSFLQKNFKPASLVQVAEHFKNNSKSFKRSSWNKIFKMLASISASAPIQADAGAVQQIIDLIDALLEKIAESREIQRREYEAWVSEYQDARDAQVSLLNQTVSQIENLENEISALTKRIDNATAERDEQRERSRQKGIELVERQKWCDDEAESYADRRQGRTEKLSVISDTIGLIE